MPIQIQFPDLKAQIKAVVRRVDGTISTPETQSVGDPK